MTEALQARSCPWCHQFTWQTNDCKHVWHLRMYWLEGPGSLRLSPDRRASLEEGPAADFPDLPRKALPIHEKVFATVGNVDLHRKEPVPDFENPSWLVEDLETIVRLKAGDAYMVVSTDRFSDLAEERNQLREVNEGLRLQIEHLGLELAHAHLECGERAQDLAKVRDLAQRHTDRHSHDSAVVRFAYEVLELTP